MALAVVVCLLLLVLASLADAATRVDPIPHDNAFAPLAGGSSVPYGRVDRKGGVEMTGSLLFNTTLPFVFVDSLPGFRRFVRGKKAGTWVLTGHSASIDRAAEAWKGHVGNLLVSAEPRWGMIAEEGEVTHDPDHAAKLVTRIEKRNGTALVLHIADAPRRSVIGVEARALVPFSLLSRDMTFSGTYKTDLPNLWYSRGPMSIGCNNCNLTLKGSVYIWGGLSLKGIGVCSTVTVSADLQLNPYFTLSASAAAEYEFFRKPVPNLSISFWCVSVGLTGFYMELSGLSTNGRTRDACRKFTIGVQAIAKAVAGTGASFTAQASFFMSTGDLKFSKTLAGATTQCGSSHIGNGFTFRQTADPSLAVSTQPFSVTLGIATVLLVGVQYSKTTYGVYAGPEVGIQYAAEKLSDCPKATKKSLSLVSQLDVGLEYNQKGTWDTSFSLFTLPLWKKSDPTTGYTQCGSSCIDNNQFATDVSCNISSRRSICS